MPPGCVCAGEISGCDSTYDGHSPFGCSLGGHKGCRSGNEETAHRGENRQPVPGAVQCGRAIVRIFLDMEESEVSKIFRNEDFAYWSIVVERPLRLRIFPEREIPAGTFKKAADLSEAQKAIGAVPKDTPLDDWTAFAKATKLKATALKKIRPFITEKDETAKAIESEPDVELRDTENVPFTYEGGIDAFMKNEVLTYAPYAWVDESRTQIGYEISFTKYFYKPKELREMKKILADLTALEKEADGMMAEIMRDLR